MSLKVTIPPKTTFAAEVTATDFKASGMTGATAASRYVGGTASGAPASGTFAVGDFVVDQTGKAWVCTGAGTPGTWAQLAGGGGGGSSTLAGLTDALISSPLDTQVLSYETASSKWKNKAQTGAPQGALVPLQEVIVGAGGAANIQFSSIPQIYRHLQLLVDVRSDTAAVQTVLCLQCNGDSANNYYDSYLYATQGAVAGANTGPRGSFYVCDMNAGTAPSGAASGVDLVLFNYAASTFQKEARSISTLRDANSAGSLYVETAAHWWLSTAAVTSLLLFPSAGNFVQGTTATLYGVMGTGAAYGGGPMTTLTNQLAADVTLSSANTYYDGPSLTLTAGTWLVSSTLTCQINAGASYFTGKLWDGTTAFDSTQETSGASANYPLSLSLSAVVTPTASTTYKASVACSGSGGKVMAAASANAAGNTASTIVAVLLSTAGTANILPAFATKTANYTLTNADSLIVLNATGITATLPLAASVPPGREFWVKNAGVTANTVAVSGSDHIDGAVSVGLPSAYMALTLVSDGSANYYLI